MKKFLLAVTLTIAIVGTTFTQSVEAKKPFNCARAKRARKCRSGRFAVRGCFWCGSECTHHSECESDAPTCEKLRARSRKQKMICKAQGCDVEGRGRRSKCVTPDDDASNSDSTKAPTKAPTKGCSKRRRKVRVFKGKVDDSVQCSQECPCGEYVTGCSDDSECKGELKCSKASRGEFGLKVDVSVCLSDKSIEEPEELEETDVDDEEDEEEDEDEEEIGALPSLESVKKNPSLLSKLPKGILNQLDDDMLKLAQTKPNEFLKLLDSDDAIIDKYNPTRPPVKIQADEVGDIAFVNKLCDRVKRNRKLGKLGFCSSIESCKCGEGEGWCRNDNECMAGLKCQKKRGKYYGLGAGVAVCVRDESQPGVWESSGKFEGDIDIETSKSGIQNIVERYGLENAQVIVDKFPGSARDGAAVKPSLTLTLPPITTKGPIPTIPPVPERPITDTIKNIRGGGRQLMQKRQLGATEKNILWPNGVVYYRYHSGVSDSVKSVIEDAMKHWEDRTCITFQQRSHQANYVEFQQPSGVCSSAIGMQGGKQIIKLAQACGFGAAVHEIMHALGFWHEQSRPDRDSFVTINWDNIQNGKSHNFNKKAGSEIDSMGSNYDFGSIMHYGKTAFSKNGEDTITPKVAGVTIGQRTGLSAHDIWQVKKLYNCLEDCPNGFYTKKFYRGTAPFCSGTCPRTSREIGRSKTGGGSTCWFGTKAHCQSCCKQVTTTQRKWFGTAPFCNGRCPSGWTYVRRSKRGNGARCWTGWKHYCQRVTQVEQCQRPEQSYDPSCPPGGNKYFWFGRAPFCNGRCPTGWTQVKTSKTGDGATCWTGNKVQCRKSC